MELQFQSKPWNCLKRAAWEVKESEQTQEIKLSEDLPDVGRVLCAWGQCVLRGKEWRNGAMLISGGMMSWVLYEPEGGAEPVCVESWIPFQLRWDLPETKRDGSILAACTVKSVDARALSARRLMVRGVVSGSAEAMEPVQEMIYAPGELPEDVQVHRRNYPVCIPVEAGEKAFFLEEMPELPGTATPVEKLMYFTLQPQIAECRVMGDKAVFRGDALLHLLYRGIDGQLKTWDWELPFSQYTDLDGEYGPDALLRVIPAVTNLELEKREDGTLGLRAGIVGQYCICDQRMLEVVEDAYSTQRQVQTQIQQLQLPTVLDTVQTKVAPEKNWEVAADRCLDVDMRLGQPGAYRTEDGVEASVAGSFQVLYREESGEFAVSDQIWEESQAVSMGRNTACSAVAIPYGRPTAMPENAGITARGEAELSVTVMAAGTIPMVTGLTLGDAAQPDPGRPSLVLRRAGNGPLWDTAKKYGTTVDAIRKANDLTEEPAPDRILLIPMS